MALIRIGQARKKPPEENWGGPSDDGGNSWGIKLTIGLLMVAAILTVAALLFENGVNSSSRGQVPVAKDKLAAGIDDAGFVARSFLQEVDPKKRLEWVRNSDVARMHMDSYSVEAREFPGTIEKVIGHVSEAGRTVTAFAVAMSTGNMRLLEVVTTKDGPKVDWDAYARYGTANWKDLLSGKAQKAVVRVFCEPSTERPEPFEDQSKWTCFRMSSPELPQAVLGFAEVESVREAMMKQVVLGSPNYRQRFVLEVVRHEGKDEPLFEIVRCHVVGWIEADRAVEEEWAAE